MMLEGRVHVSAVLSQRGVRQCMQSSAIGAQPPDRDPTRRKGMMSVRAPSTSRSVMRATAWVYVAPFVAVAGLALVALAFGAFAVFVQVLAALLKHTGI
jgi:hypothetical protein